MSVQRCQFCPTVATGVVRAEGLTSPVLYCDADACWARAWRMAAHRIPRSWGPLPRTKSRRRARDTGQGDLFDLLPTKGSPT